MGLEDMRCELLEVEGAFNVRDLGGYLGTGGRPVKYREFIRSGSLSDLTEKGVEQLKAAGVRCIIDLRSNGESRRHPDAVPMDSGITCLRVSMLDHLQSNIDSGDFSTFPPSLEVMYEGLLDGAREQLGMVFRWLAEHPGAVLFHCTAGKDRTGLVAMLLLLLAGVSEEDIMEDYSWSGTLMAPLLEKQDSKKFPSYGHESRPETIKHAIEYLRENHGGAAEYLLQSGVSQEQIEKIVRKLL